MRRVFWLIAAALLLAGCAGEKGIVEKEGYQLDTRRQARALGADAVVGIDIDYETVGQNGSMLMVSVSGTAVKTRR